MTVLLLTLSGAMQSWGERSRFTRRETSTEPTKSGVVGLLAAALGYRRTDPIEKLAGLGFGVRIDQPGVMLRDFQTAKSMDGKRAMPLSYRYYVTDAVFLAAVEGEHEWMAALAEALQRPTFPLYLGRRSCPPMQPVINPRTALRESTGLFDVLSSEPWSASDWYREKLQAVPRVLTVAIDADLAPSDDRLFARESPRRVHDVPISFDPAHRQYGVRSTVRGSVLNPDATSAPHPRHDPMNELGGA